MNVYPCVIYSAGIVYAGLLRWFLITSFLVGTARAQGIATQHRQLHVRVLDHKNHGVSAKVSLTSYDTAAFSYTDRMGNADFYEIPAGNYALVVTVGGTEMHRDQISLLNAEGFRSELVRLHVPAVSRAQTVSVNELGVPKSAKNYYSTGKKAVAVQNWEEALAAFNNAIKTYPRYAKALNAKGAVLAVTGQLSEAELTFRRAVELDPKLAESHFNLGKLLLESNRQLEAKSELTLSVDLGYQNPAAIDLLVQSMLETHDEDSAVLLVRSLHRTHIGHAPGLHLEIGSALERLSKAELAIDQYSLALKENPTESDRKKAEIALQRLSLFSRTGGGAHKVDLHE